MRDYGDWCRRPEDSPEDEWIYAAAGIAAFVGAILLLVYLQWGVKEGACQLRYQ